MSNDEASAPPPKRKRLDENSGKQSDEIQRSPEFWFDDGSIVLQTKTTRFRVHRSVLCANSKYFKKLFDAATAPLETLPLIEGCPVVQVEGTEREWDNVLTFIYFPRKIKQGSRELPLDFLAPLLRLGRRYEFEHVLGEGLEYIKNYIPAKYSEVFTWNKMERERIFDFINLAVELDIQTALPNLYYLCCLNYSMEEITSGFAGIGPSNAISRLTVSTWKTVLIGRDRLRPSISRHIFGWSFESTPVFPPKKCTKKDECRAARRAWRKERGVYFGSDDFARLRHTSPDAITSGKLCDKCAAFAQEKHSQGITNFWKNLPSVFDLPEWENLKDFGI